MPAGTGGAELPQLTSNKRQSVSLIPRLKVLTSLNNTAAGQIGELLPSTWPSQRAPCVGLWVDSDRLHRAYRPKRFERTYPPSLYISF